MGAAMGLAAAAVQSDDQGTFEDIKLVLGAMKDFTPRQFQVLHSKATGTGLEGKDCRDDLLLTSVRGIGPNLGISEVRVEASLIALSDLGLVAAVKTWGGNSYPVTPLGQAILNAADTVIE